MFILLIIVHIICCFVLISAILLQAGRGGGLTEAIGGEGMQSVLGTQAPSVLKKVTTIGAIGFLCTSLLLGMVTARRGRSIFERSKLPTIPVTQERVNAVVNEQEQKTAEVTTQVPTPTVSQETAQAVSQEEPQSARQAETFAEVTENESGPPY